MDEIASHSPEPEPAPKRPRGRPPGDPAARRDRAVVVNLTADEHARASARAREQGTPLATAARALLLPLIGALLLSLSFGCGASARDVARVAVYSAAEAVDVADQIESIEAARAAARALESAADAAAYVAAMEPHYVAERVLRGARAAVSLGRHVLETWDAGGAERWIGVAGCIALGLADIADAFAVAGVELPAEVGSALEIMRGLASGACGGAS